MATEYSHGCCQWESGKANPGSTFFCVIHRATKSISYLEGFSIWITV
jgi:hypothetical protein